MQRCNEEDSLERFFDIVKIGNGLRTENEKLRPPYRPFSCCLAASERESDLRSRDLY